MMPRLMLVIGPPGAGKTTWARAELARLPGVWYLADAEELLRATRPVAGWPTGARPLQKALYATVLRVAAERALSLIVTAGCPTRVERERLLLPFRTTHGTTILTLLPPVDVCAARARADPLRPASSRGWWPTQIANWYRLYEPVAAAEANVVAAL